MGKYPFYYPDGTEIDDIKEFIKFYSRMYYYVDHNFALEAEMEKLLRRDSKCDLELDDLNNILLWKTDGTLNGSEIITRYHQINTDDALEAYEAWKSDCRENSYSGEKAFTELLRQLKKRGVKGIGPVIAITIIYYDSCGEHPIYDRFADIAVRIILSKSPFTENLNDRSLNNTTAKNAYSIYEKYNTNLKTIFEDCYNDTDRDIDRALWVYGHMFSKNKNNQKKEEGFPKFKEWRDNGGKRVEGDCQ